MGCFGISQIRYSAEEAANGWSEYEKKERRLLDLLMSKKVDQLKIVIDVLVYSL